MRDYVYHIRYIIVQLGTSVTDSSAHVKLIKTPRSEDPCHVQIHPAVVSAALVQELCLVSEIKSL